ncbi:hypothetical protein ACQR0V_12195 [Bradyrhizobium sp. HKCCYLS2058]|uniref:hypothetical protein n=1 Tax=unclassified Bradyrhizobium TaxID=2631580 RepID=UPI003EBAFEE9
MVDSALPASNGWTSLEILGASAAVLLLVWIAATVLALHRRDVYFWGLGSTWISLIAFPIAILIMSISAWSAGSNSNDPLAQVPLFGGAALYVAVFGFCVFYNFGATKSVWLAISTSLLQQLAGLGLIFLFLRWRGDKVNREHRV